MTQKTCTRCGEIKDLTEFRKQKRSKDGYAQRCKLCADIGTEASRAKNPAKYKTKRKELRERNWEQYQDFKASLGCAIPGCNENDPVCLEFHHLDPEEKRHNPSSLWNNQKRLFEEIADGRCICVCSNCHKKIHAGRSGFEDYLLKLVKIRRGVVQLGSTRALECTFSE